MGKNELTISKVMIKILRLFITTIAALIAVLLLINFIPFIKRSSFNIGLTLAVLICIFFFDKEKLHDFGLKISKESLSLFIKGLAYALISFLISLTAVYFFRNFYLGTVLLFHFPNHLTLSVDICKNNFISISNGNPNQITVNTCYPFSYKSIATTSFIQEILACYKILADTIQTTALFDKAF